MSEITDKEIIECLPKLGYFAAQSNYYGHVHICKPSGGLKAVGICGQTADPTAQIRKGASLCGLCRRPIVREIRAAQRDQEALKRWTGANPDRHPAEADE